MLKTVGVKSVDELFDQVPRELRLNRPLQLPPPLSEIELESHLRDLASRNVGASGRVSFLGGGIYDHFVPAAVDAIAGRSEFYTAYTPYQAEASQGSLQAFFEYQTLICELTGMDVSNASLYEGASAMVEAVLMAMRVTQRRDKVVVLGSVHPEYRDTLTTYVRHLGCEIVTVPTPQGTADPNDVARLIDDRTAAVVVQHPNFFGCLESPREIFAATKQRAHCRFRSSTRSASACCNVQPRTEPTSRPLKVSRLASRCSTEGRISASSPADKNSCGRCPAGSSAKRLIATANAASC